MKSVFLDLKERTYVVTVDSATRSIDRYKYSFWPFVALFPLQAAKVSSLTAYSNVAFFKILYSIDM